MSFYILAVITSALFGLLALVWMFAPTKLTSSWGLPFVDATGLVGRRAAALYAGIAIMFFIARNAEPSLTRDALVYGLVTTCIMLALLGFYEFITGKASKGILAAACIEVALILLMVTAT